MNNQLLVKTILEGFADGLLILTEQGDIVCANTNAHQICCRLLEQNSSHKGIPLHIWHICQNLIDSRTLYPDQLLMLEDEIHTDRLSQYRIRVQWFNLATVDQRCFLVTLEDRFQLAKRLAIAEQQKYGLTAREAEIWQLRRANFSYKEIASNLFIAVDTVKKHIKNIHAKQDASRLTN